MAMSRRSADQITLRNQLSRLVLMYIAEKSGGIVAIPAQSRIGPLLFFCFEYKQEVTRTSNHLVAPFQDRVHRLS